MAEPDFTNIPYGYCQCGCAQPTGFYKRSNSTKGIKAGERKRFIRGHQNRAYYGCTPQTSIEADRGYDTPCWAWQRKISSNGYGHVTVEGKCRLAHRYYYEFYRGEIPEGLTIDHLCKQRDCVNPEHMEAVPPHVNQRRSGRTILSRDVITAIEYARSLGVPYSTLETLTGIKQRTIRAAAKKENWSEH